MNRDMTKQERITEARKHHKTKNQRRVEAAARTDLWNELTPIGKLKRVRRRGGAERETTKLAAPVAQQEAAKVKKSS